MKAYHSQRLAVGIGASYRELRSIFTTVIVAGCCVVLFGGCFSRPAVNKQYFAFSLPQPPSLSPTGQGRILGIRRITVDPPFDSQPLAYRTGGFSYERDPYAEFLAPPARGLIAPIRGYFRRNSVFSDVVEPGSALRPNTVVEITVAELYGDFRIPDRPSAVLTMRFVFFDASNGVPGKVLLERGYTRTIPLRARTAADLMVSWNEGLEQIIGAAATDLRAELEGR